MSTSLSNEQNEMPTSTEQNELSELVPILGGIVEESILKHMGKRMGFMVVVYPDEHGKDAYFTTNSALTDVLRDMSSITSRVEALVAEGVVHLVHDEPIINPEDLPLKVRLKNAGFTIQRMVDERGAYKGIQILDSKGTQVHDTPRANYELGLELVRSKGF